jgi:DNA polymerase III delta subunit
LPEDRRFNPLAINPYVLYKALPQVKRYTEAELIRAMDLLFQCNLRLVSSSLDESLVLQQALVQIVGNASLRPGVESARSLAAASPSASH